MGGSARRLSPPTRRPVPTAWGALIAPTLDVVTLAGHAVRAMRKDQGMLKRARLLVACVTLILGRLGRGGGHR